MRRFLPVAALVAITSAGCVPVTEPVGDIDKSEPDKNLLGNWNGSGEMAIDVPDVKGNPKGLMRAVNDGKVNDPQNVLWFFTTKIGKHTYANVILTSGKPESPAFHKEGEFEKWRKESKHHFFIFRYTIDGEKLAIDGGNKDAAEKLMTDATIKRTDSWYEAPAGWLAKYLEKTGPDDVFDGSNANKYTRKKK